MAPSVEEWEALSPVERAAVVAALPGEVTDAEISMPEGERHFKAKARALDALRGYFARQRRRIHLAAEMPTYYPAEPRFAPDLFAVLDSDDTGVTSGSSTQRVRGSTGCSRSTSAVIFPQRRDLRRGFAERWPQT